MRRGDERGQLDYKIRRTWEHAHVTTLARTMRFDSSGASATSSGQSDAEKFNGPQVGLNLYRGIYTNEGPKVSAF